VVGRDLWSDDTTQSLVRESFVFWQKERSSTEAQRIISLYNPPSPFPQVFVIDPRTGERLATLKLKKKEGDLREAFFDQITAFLDPYSFEPAAKAKSSNTAAKAKNSSETSSSSNANVPESDEDKELAAAIKASLMASNAQENIAIDPKNDKPVEAPQTTAPSNPVVRRSFIPLQAEPNAGPDTTTIQFRFTDGSRLKRRFLKSSPVGMLFSFVAESGKVSKEQNFELLTSEVPAKPLGQLEEKSLTDADACNQALIIRLLD